MYVSKETTSKIYLWISHYLIGNDIKVTCTYHNLDKHGRKKVSRKKLQTLVEDVSRKERYPE